MTGPDFGASLVHLVACSPSTEQQKAWFPTRRGGGGDYRVGHPQILVPCVQLRAPQSLGHAADTREQLFWDAHWAHNIILRDTQVRMPGDPHHLPAKEKC